MHNDLFLPRLMHNNGYKTEDTKELSGQQEIFCCFVTKNAFSTTLKASSCGKGGLQRPVKMSNLLMKRINSAPAFYAFSGEEANF